MDCRLTEAERNHLRRLIGWVACEVGQTPDEMVATVRNIAPAIQDASEEGKVAIMQVTQEMLEAAMKAAVQTGLLPKYADGETYLQRWEAMKQCIQAAIDAGPEVTPNAEVSGAGTASPGFPG